MKNLDIVIKQVITVLQEKIVSKQEKLVKTQELIYSKSQQSLDMDIFERRSLKYRKANTTNVVKHKQLV